MWKQSDISAIRKANESAFNGPIEGHLVDLLREVNQTTLSLVVILDDKIAGHLLFSPTIIGLP